MSSPPGINPGVPQTPAVQADLQALTEVCRRFKQGLDSLAGYAGDILGRAVTYNDIINLGLVSTATVTAQGGGHVDFATNSALDNSINNVNSTISDFSSNAHTWTQEQIIHVTSGPALLVESGSYTATFGDAGATFGGGSFTITDGPVTVVFDGSGFALDGGSFGLTGGGSIGVTGGSISVTGGNIDISGGSLTVSDGIVVGAPTGGNLGVGSVNATELAIDGVALETVATSAQANPAAPPSTTATAGAMMGFAIAITPTRSGKLLIIASGLAQNNSAHSTTGVQICVGTGTAPVFSAALTGAVGVVQAVSIDASSLQCAFGTQVIDAGHAVGAALWIDLAVFASTGTAASIKSVSVSVVEL